jgi:hypothetical protein
MSTEDLSAELPLALACPFCGHEGLDFREGSTFRWLAYSCAGCGMGSEVRMLSPAEAKPAERRSAAERDAIIEWNRRASSAAAVPAGWKLVPVEPTREMLEATGPGTYWHKVHREAWTAMLAATPAPPQAVPATDAAPVAVDAAPELPPLPSPWDVCYLWREPTGLHRSFSAHHYNGRACDDQVLLYTQAELKEYGDARARAALRAAGAGNRESLTEERIVLDGLMSCPTALLSDCTKAFEAGVRFAEAAHGIAARGTA